MKTKVKTKKQKRIECVKDVLARLRYRNVEEGYYLNTFLQNLPDSVEKPTAKELRQFEKCEACAKGNLFLSHLRLYDGFTCNQIRYEGNLEDIQSDALTEYFDQDQLNLIENAFEGCTIKRVNNSYENEKAKEFGKKFSKPKARLRAICKNILENDGTFIP